MDHATPYLKEMLVFLGMAGILIPLLRKLRIDQTLGFLTFGALVGPFGLARLVDDFTVLRYVTISEVNGITALGEFGILFLMFMIGLELSVERLWMLRRWVFGAGIAQLVLSAAAIGGVALLFGNRIESAIILGLVLSLSSTAVVMQMLTERQALSSPIGQAAFAILMLQDLAVVPIFLLIPVLEKGYAEGTFVSAFLAFAKSAATITVLYLIGRRLVRPLFRFFADQYRAEVFMALTLLIVLGIGTLTAAAGLSMALGALLAGLLLAETEYRHEVEATIGPFKSLLMGLFFLAVGMQIDVLEVLRNPVWIPLSVLGLIVIKSVVLIPLFRIAGLSWGQAVEGGMLLGQGGEFAFIIIGYATAARLIDTQTGQFMAIVVSLSMFATPAATRLGGACRRLQERLSRFPSGPEPEPNMPALAGKVVIAGFGRVGQLLGQVLSQHDIGYIALDKDAGLVSRLYSERFPVYFGDASHMQTFKHLGIGEAAAIVLTMDHPLSALRAVKAIRQSYPFVPLYSRSRDDEHALELRQAGATVVIPEALEVGLQLATFALQSSGIDDSSILHFIEQKRKHHFIVPTMMRQTCSKAHVG
jgi:CPA2 family monovalent cation:H+ antiporter-2